MTMCAMNIYLSRQISKICFAGLLVLFATTLLAGLYDSSPDKTPISRWPQLSTSHGPIKSGGSIKEVIDGSIDLLLTDMPMTDAELQIVYERRRIRLAHIATAVTTVVPCYNLRGVRQPLKFSSETLAAIFLGKITKWNDPALQVLNPVAHLPAADIVVIHHAADDGSTFALSDFLTKTDSQWRHSVGTVRSFSSTQPSALQAPSQEDVAALVKRTPYSIAYMELWAARSQGLDMGSVKNRSGHFIQASPVAATSAAQNAIPSSGDDFRASITDANGVDDYPVASFTWVVVPRSFADPEKRSVVSSFLKWVLSEGQDSTEAMQFGRLPARVASREIGIIDSFEMAGH